MGVLLCKHHFQFKCTTQQVWITLKIVTMDGQIAKEEIRKPNFIIGNLPLSVASLPKGVYVVSVSNDSGVTLQQKLVVQ
jgi:hypothetical protein